MDTRIIGYVDTWICGYADTRIRGYVDTCQMAQVTVADTNYLTIDTVRKHSNLQVIIKTIRLSVFIQITDIKRLQGMF